MKFLRQLLVIASLVSFSIACASASSGQGTKISSQTLKVSKVAIFPWTFTENERGTSERGVEKVRALLIKLFEEKGGMEVVSPAICSAAWKQVSGQAWTELIEDPKDQPKVPDSKLLLEFGRLAGADYVCAGNLEWNVKSKWVGLGPKTRVTAFADVKIIDVNKKEEALNVVDYGSNTGSAEQWWQSAGSLLLTWGFTVFSGGPKTPHVEKSGIIAVGGATDPFFMTLKNKIK